MTAFKRGVLCNGIGQIGAECGLTPWYQCHEPGRDPYCQCLGWSWLIHDYWACQ